MMKRLGRAERTLRDINLDDNSDDSSAAITSRRRAIDAILSDDEDVARRRRHIHTQPVCNRLHRSMFTTACPLSVLKPISRNF